MKIKSAREIECMRKPGLLVWEAHKLTGERIEPGVTTGELDQIVEELFAKHDAEPLFKGYPGPTPFPAVTCISVNDAVVHGIPGDYVLQEGDIVSIDTGCRIDGWCGDAAVTHAVGKISNEAQKLLDITSGVLDLSIQLLTECERWSQVSRKMQAYVEEAGFSLVESCVCHGIGRDMHEAPQVPNHYSKSFEREEDFQLRKGLVLAIEPMVNIGTPDVTCLDDQWTQVTLDGSLSAHFEHTVAITADGPIRLTGPPS
ncbi:MAG: type I methionyl aminopeptidase [Planctomycetota bacterium]